MIRWKYVSFSVHAAVEVGPTGEALELSRDNVFGCAQVCAASLAADNTFGFEEFPQVPSHPVRCDAMSWKVSSALDMPSQSQTLNCKFTSICIYTQYSQYSAYLVV